MNYEKAYKEALERAKDIKNGSCPRDGSIATADYIFPELKESEDERIRKEIIEFISWAESRGSVRSDWHQKKCPGNWIAYLEKQKEQKPVNHNLTTFHRDVVYCAMCNKNLDEGLRYNLEIVYNVLKDIVAQTPIVCEQKEQKLVECELEDAFKNYTDAGITVSCGDIVAKPKEQKPVEIHIDNPNIQKVDPNVKISTSDSSASGDELLYVSNKSYRLGYQDGKREAGQKPAEWSEEDKRKLNRIYEILGYAADDKGFLTSKRIIGDKEAIELQDFLKSLRPSWKPSEWQMSMLLAVINDPNNAGAESCQLALKSLYEQLRKRM